MNAIPIDRLRPPLSAFESFDSMGIEPYMREFIESNGASHDNPYHSLAHAFRVAESAISAANWDAPINGFTPEDFRAVAVAGLFHDWGHPGGVGSKDNENVLRASEKVLSLPPIPDAPFDREKAAKAILDTVYPLSGGEDLSYMGLVLRDADIWHAAFLTDTEFFSSVVKGLAQEQHISVAECCHRQVGFFRSVDAFTDWAKRVRSAEAGRLVQHCEDMAELLGWGQ